MREYVFFYDMREYLKQEFSHVIASASLPATGSCSAASCQSDECCILPLILTSEKCTLSLNMSCTVVHKLSLFQSQCKDSLACSWKKFEHGNVLDLYALTSDETVQFPRNFIRILASQTGNSDTQDYTNSEVRTVPKWLHLSWLSS